MPSVRARSRAARVPAALATVLAMVLVLLVPTAASAEVPGGTDWASATPLPVASFDESFSASNASVVSSVRHLSATTDQVPHPTLRARRL